MQPISRVQHVERVQGPLDKRYGVAKLKLFSAGTGGVSFAIPGLAVETAVRLQNFILARKREIGEASPEQDGIADGHEPAAGTALAAEPGLAGAQSLEGREAARVEPGTRSE